MPVWTIRRASPADGVNINKFYCRSGRPYLGYNSAIVGNGALYGANVLNNCVGYSVGRCAEIYDELNPNVITSTGTNPFNVFAPYNAEDWVSVALTNNWNTGMTPAVGAVGVWYSAQQNIGHVANIEDYQNGVWEISESHYYYPNGNGSWDYSYLQSGSDFLPAFIGADSSWALLGFIYPDYTEQPMPINAQFISFQTPFGKRKIKRNYNLFYR